MLTLGNTNDLARLENYPEITPLSHTFWNYYLIFHR